MELKLSNIDLTPGSIISWQEYPWYKRVIAKLRKKELKPNRFYLVKRYTRGENIFLLNKAELYILKPISRYSKNEVQKLYTISDHYCDKIDLITDLLSIRKNNQVEYDYITYYIK